jgi:hypothetical protein
LDTSCGDPSVHPDREKDPAMKKKLEAAFKLLNNLPIK